MPIRNRRGGLHRGTLFDTNVPATSIDKDIFTDQTVETSIADDDLVLMLDVSETPDVIKYMTRSNFVDGLSGGTITVTDNESTDENNLIAFIADAATSTGLHGMEMDGDFHYNPSTGTLTATTFAGNLTGNASGSAATLASGRTIGMTGDVVWTSASFDGSGNVTGTAAIQANSVVLGTDSTGNYVGTVTAGTGLTSTGATSGEGISHSLSVDAVQSQITTVGTIDTGTWEGDTVAVGQGGTGATSLSNLITLATHTTGDYVQNITGGTGIDSTGATSGENIAHSLSLDLSELTDTAIANGDYIVFTDTTDSNATVKGDLADVATLFAGTGLTASSSVIGVDAAQSGITSVGTLTGLTLDGDKSVTPGDGAMVHLDTSTITDSATSGSGTATKYTHVNIEAPTLAATNSSVTTSDVATLYINAAATAGTNQTITRNWAMWVDTGNARFDGSIYSGTTEAINSSGLVTVANQSNITGVSTITSGTWEGTTVAVAQGGTGATSLTNLFTLGTHTTGNYLATLANATNGGTTIANSGSETAAATVAMNMNDLAAGVMADGDSIAFIDANDSNLTKKEALADLLDTVAGVVGTTGLDRSGATLVVTDLHPVGVSGSANQLLTDDGDGTVTSEAQLSFDGDVLAITGTGTAKGNKDILTITNDVNAADMDATETSILFNQWYYDGASPAVADSGRISIGTEQDWTSTASTQDSYIAFETALNGTVSEKLRINSDGHIVPVGDDTYDIGTSGAQFKDGYFDGTLYADAIDFNGSAVTTTATLSTGISNTNVLVANAAIIDDDFLRVDGTSIEGRSASEVASDIGAATIGLSVAMAIAL